MSTPVNAHTLNLTLTIQDLLDKTVKLFFKSKQVKEEPETAKPLPLDEIRTEK
jgi:hypothetical protein